MPIPPLERSEEEDQALDAPVPIVFSPNKTAQSPDMLLDIKKNDKSNSASPIVPNLYTDASINRRKEKRKYVHLL